MEAKEKTAMGQLIERLQEMYNDEYFPNYAKEGILIAINTATNELNSLATEKQQIVDAVNYGNRQEFYDGTETTGEQYYQEQFNPSPPSA